MADDIDSKIWEQKDLRMARMAAIKGSTRFITACIEMEIYKPKNLEEGFDEIKKFYGYIVDEIYNGMETVSESKPSRDEGNTNGTVVDLATAKQRNLMTKLNIHWDEKTTKQEASELIDEHFKKQNEGG